jgi:hypothetical protein
MSRKAIQMGEEWRTRKAGGEASSEERSGGCGAEEGYVVEMAQKGQFGSGAGGEGGMAGGGALRAGIVSRSGIEGLRRSWEAVSAVVRCAKMHTWRFGIFLVLQEVSMSWAA